MNNEGFVILRFGRQVVMVIKMMVRSHLALEIQRSGDHQIIVIPLQETDCRLLWKYIH